MLTALAASAVVAHQFAAVADQIEDLINQLVVSDPILANLPFVDPSDWHCVNPAWTTRAYCLIDERSPHLGLPFVEWYTAEEARANRDRREPVLPWHQPRKYPVLEIQRNGQVDVRVG